MSLTICKKCPDEKQVERTNNCTLNFYGTQQARMSSDGLGKAFIITGTPEFWRTERWAMDGKGLLSINHV